ncbi:hypothetical protein L9F63_010120, partial [Diploptera punctata]
YCLVALFRLRFLFLSYLDVNILFMTFARGHMQSRLTLFIFGVDLISKSTFFYPWLFSINNLILSFIHLLTHALFKFGTRDMIAYPLMNFPAHARIGLFVGKVCFHPIGVIYFHIFESFRNCGTECRQTWRKLLSFIIPGENHPISMYLLVSIAVAPSYIYLFTLPASFQNLRLKKIKIRSIIQGRTLMWNIVWQILLPGPLFGLLNPESVSI